MHEMANCTSNFLVKISKKFEFLYVFLIGWISKIQTKLIINWRDTVQFHFKAPHSITFNLEKTISINFSISKKKFSPKTFPKINVAKIDMLSILNTINVSRYLKGDF
jgi:hypothetical protein